MRRPLASAVTVAVVAFLAACGTSGRAMETPPPDATAPPREASSTAHDETRPAPVSDTFTLNTFAWTPGSDMPRTYTCDGIDVSPPLTIANTPAETVELALVATGSGEVGWLVAGVAPEVIEIEQDTVPEGAVVAANSSGEVGWTGPCPPEGGGARLFDITLYALSAPSGVTEGMPTEEAVALVTDPASVIATSVLTGAFSR